MTPPLAVERDPKGPKLTTVNNDLPYAEIANILKRDGGVIVRNMVGAEHLAKLKDELEKAKVDGDTESNTFFPSNCARAYSLVENCPTYAEALLQNKVLLGVVNETITSKFTYWAGERRTATSPPQLSTAGAVMLGPGAKPQDFHRDDMCWHRAYDAVDTYKEGRDVEVSTLLAVTKSTFENGATRVIPGSHLWDNDREPKWSDGVAFAEMEAGSALIFLGSVYHAGGYNQTKDEWRVLCGASFVRGYFRQEENQYLGISNAVAKKLPRDVQGLIGYSISLPYCGYVALDEPLKLLRGETIKGKDLF